MTPSLHFQMPEIDLQQNINKDFLGDKNTSAFYCFVICLFSTFCTRTMQYYGVQGKYLFKNERKVCVLSQHERPGAVE